MYKAKSVEFHRNGVSGDPFSVIHLSDQDGDLTAIVFEDAERPYGGVAVISPTDPKAKFRGDHFAPALRDLIAHYDELTFYEGSLTLGEINRAHKRALANLGGLVPTSNGGFSYEQKFPASTIPEGR